MTTQVKSLEFMQNPPRISYYSELQIDYTKETRAATSIKELRAVLKRYEAFAFDARKKARKLTWKD